MVRFFQKWILRIYENKTIKSSKQTINDWESKNTIANGFLSEDAFFLAKF